MTRFILAVPLMMIATMSTAQKTVPPVEMNDPGATGRRVAKDGLIGNFYPASVSGKQPGILIVGGSEGGLGTGTTRMALALQMLGYNVLHLSFFRAPGQSEALQRIPLERFAAGIAWLQRQHTVDAKRIGLIGGSKGAEAVLLVASRTPAVRAVVAGMPSSVVWPAFAWQSGLVEGSSWTAGGKDLPSLPYGTYTPPNLASLYASGLIRISQHPDAAIAIEGSKAQVLLICGEADTLWPSCPMARQLKARDERRVTVLTYPDAGHAVFGVPVNSANPNYKYLGSLGGTAAGNAAARTDGWPKVVTFLRNVLAPHEILGR